MQRETGKFKIKSVMSGHKNNKCSDQTFLRLLSCNARKNTEKHPKRGKFEINEMKCFSHPINVFILIIKEIKLLM